MDVFFEETDWLCSPGTSFAPLGESHERGKTSTWTDFVTTRKNRPKGQFFENPFYHRPINLLMYADSRKDTKKFKSYIFMSDVICLVSFVICLLAFPRNADNGTPPRNQGYPKKYPAYGRQSISRPMRIVAPIPKNPASKAKFAEKLTFFRTAILHPLRAKVLQSETTSLHYFSPRIPNI